MTQEVKQLLLKDLCVRLSYGPKVQYTTGDGLHIDCGIDMVSIASECVGIYELGTSRVVWRGIEDIKPYLRPLSSMTEDEKDEYDRLVMYNASWVVDDWLNKRHFDYRGLIFMGLALEAKEGMYKTE